jgi:nucleotide-binding universal stress UspA family protein
MKTYRTIIWASDGSAGADAALPHALRLAEVTGAQVLAVHIDHRLTGRTGNWPALTAKNDVRTRLRDQVAELKRRGTNIQFMLRHTHQDAADVVAAVAKELDADVIVCGTRGRGAFGRVFLGSFTVRLMHVAPCPVLGVPTLTAATIETKREEADWSVSGSRSSVDALSERR